MVSTKDCFLQQQPADLFGDVERNSYEIVFLDHIMPVDTMLFFQEARTQYNNCISAKVSNLLH